MFSDLINYSLFKPYGVIGLRISNHNLKDNIQKLKSYVEKIFENLDKLNLFTLKSYISDHIAKDKSGFGPLTYLNVFI